MNIAENTNALIIEDIVNAIVAMRIQENTTYRCSKYINQRSTCGIQVDESCRTKMAEWCFQVSEYCKFSHETVGIGMSYLDRFLCTSTGRQLLHDRKSFQLAAMCALYTAIKIFEPTQMGIDLMAELSRGCYTQTEIADMEKMILGALEWRMNPPTPDRFVREFIRLFPSSSITASETTTAISDISQLQISLAISEWDFVGSKPSVIALSSILNAVELIDEYYCPTSAKMTFISQIEKIYMASTQSTEIKQMRRMLLVSISESPSTKAIIQQHACIKNSLVNKKKRQGSRALSPVCVTRSM